MVQNKQNHIDLTNILIDTTDYGRLKSNDPKKCIILSRKRHEILGKGNNYLTVYNHNCEKWETLPIREEYYHVKTKRSHKLRTN